MFLKNRLTNLFAILPILAFAGCTGNPSTQTAATANSSDTTTGAQSDIKIGFIVKQPEESWFQNEWEFADKAADKYKFSLIKIGANDGEKALSAIDNLAAQGAQGVIICTPDVKLGTALQAKAKAQNIKLFAVDDRLVGADDKPLDIPYMGISASEIGKNVGQSLLAEVKKRGWNNSEIGALAVTFEELETSRQRTDGAIEALVAGGFPKNQIYKAAQKTSDVPGAIDAASIALTQHSEVKKWLIFGNNDEAVLGAVRAMEGRGITAANIIGIGIGGSTGLVDLEKAKPTGFFGSMLISPRRHGYETSEMMYHWIKDGKKPPEVTLTSGKLITRSDYKAAMKAEGLMP